jgi:GT2 family glycosyltransferase
MTGVEPRHRAQCDAVLAPADEGSAARPGRPPTVSVIIPVHDGLDAFRACLEGLRSADPEPNEILVIVDGGADGPAELAGRSGARVLKTPARSGPAAARNLGARAARSDVLLFLDADVLMPPRVVGQVAAYFHEHPEVAAVIGSYDDAPAESNLLSQYKNLLQHYMHQRSSEEGFTFWGACGAVRRDVFLALGGYDEGYRRPSIEDIELGYRLKAAGHRVRVCKGLQVKHLKRWTAASLFRSDFFRRALPWTRLILRTRRFEDDLNISRMNRVKVALAFTLLGAGASSWWWPPAGLTLAGLVAVTLVALDAPLLWFFRRKRGLGFTLGALLWHWFHYFYSGLAFAVGVASHALRGGRDGRGVGR